MVQRHLAGLQHDVDDLVAIDVDRDLLAAADSRLSAAQVSRWGMIAATVCVPGTTRMQPLSTVLGVKATQAVTMSGGSRPQ